MGTTLRMRAERRQSCTEGLTMGCVAKAAVMTPAVTRMERMDTTETYFRESTAAGQSAEGALLRSMQSGKMRNRQMLPTTTARFCSRAIEGSRKENASRKRSPMITK